MAFIVYVIDTLGLGKPALTTKSILLMDILQHIPFYTDKVAIDGQPCFSRWLTLCASHTSHLRLLIGFCSVVQGPMATFLPHSFAKSFHQTCCNPPHTPATSPHIYITVSRLLYQSVQNIRLLLEYIHRHNNFNNIIYQDM